MEFLNVLSREEMKNVKGGSMGVCRVAWRNADGSFAGWSSSCTSVSTAQDSYNSSYTNSDGQYVSGYCCESCGDSPGGMCYT